MKNMIVLFFILTSICTYSQKIDSLTFSRLSKELLEKHPFLSLSKEDIMYGLHKKDNCISIKDKNYTVGCVSNSWNKTWVTDFNGDSIDDLIIKTEYWGPNNYGDNIKKNTFNILILNKKRNIIKTFPLYAGGIIGGGYGLLDIDSIKNGHLYTTLVNNEIEVDDKDSKEINLDFFLKNGRLHENKYLKCKLYYTNKNIFKKVKHIKEEFSFDEYYDEKKIERLSLNKNEYYTASFSGCKNRTLTFIYKDNKKRLLKPKVKKEWLKMIVFLSQKTRFKTVFLELESKLNRKQLDYNDNSYHSSYIICLANNQEVSLSFFSIGNTKEFTIRISSPRSNQLFYWDIMTNKS